MTSKSATGKRKRADLTRWLGLLLALTALLAAGCAARTSGPQTPTGDAAREPFSARAESEDGAIVAWSGYTEGYKAGAQETFEVTIQNETDQRWEGRFCLQLLDRRSSRVLDTLDQRTFALDAGVGFSDELTVRLPQDLDEGTYGLSMVVRRPGGPMVDLVPIGVGETDEVRRATTQQDMDASLEACPPVAGAEEEAGSLVAQARAELAQELGVSPDQIEVQRVEETEFPDASLGRPEPGKVYAQVITPGYVIELTVGGETYRYHASDERIVAVPNEGKRSLPNASIAIEGVEVSSDQVIVRGQSTLENGTCLNVELWADGVLQTWWPTEACAPVRQGAWELVVPLAAGQELQPGVQYVARAYQPGGPDVVSTFPFDLSAPPTPSG